jgi:hypothetical protein
MRALRLMQTSRDAGSSLTEQTAVAVMPWHPAAGGGDDIHRRGQPPWPGGNPLEKP